MPLPPPESADYCRIFDTLRAATADNEQDQLDLINTHLKREDFPKPKFFSNEVKSRTYLCSSEIYQIAKERKIKHKFKIRSARVEYINDNPVLSLNWHLYKECLQSAGKHFIIKKYSLDKAIYSHEECTLISQYLFVRGLPFYQFVNGIETFYGWVPYKDDDAIRAKIVAWVNNDHKPNYLGSEELFYHEFAKAVDEVLFWKEGSLAQTVTAHDFVTNIASTGTAGSAFDPGGPLLHVDDDGKDLHPRNKYAKSAALSADRKLEVLFSNIRQKANVSIKTEFFPKVRLIISSDFNTTMKMRFIDTWLNTWMRGNPFSTLTMTKKQLWDLWKKFASTEGINAPVDQEKFDHNTTKRMVEIMLWRILALINTRATNNAELVSVMRTIIFALDGGDVLYRDSSGTVHSYLYSSGILSGWQWTAFLDSLANQAELILASKISKRMGIPTEFIQTNVQGDDVALKVRTPVQAYAIITALRWMGFKVHPKKSFISKHHNEYLRKYALNNTVNGYPARMINNILWLYPGDRYIPETLARLNALSANWIKLGERLQLPSNDFAAQHLYLDAIGAKIKPSVVNRFMETATYLGGCALTASRQDQTIERADNIVQDDHYVRISNDPGYRDFHLRFGHLQSREMERWFISVLDLPPSETETPPDVNDVVIKPITPVTSISYQFLPSMEKPNTTRNPAFPQNVIFGQSRDFLVELFPRLDSFVNNSSAPKTWIYDYLSGRLRVPTPPVAGLSTEFAALLFSQYEASLINAMYYKRARPNKWLGLIAYTYTNFSTYARSMLATFPNMF